MNRSKSQYQRKTISFTVESFNKVVKQIEALIKASLDVTPENFYPPVKKHRGKSRDLPMVDEGLREALIGYIELRLSKGEKLKPSPRFLSHKRAGPTPPIRCKNIWR